jgi:hypothetical protein
MMSKKGQAAMEFLMTYGWAILIAIVAIAALIAFGVFNSPVQENCGVAGEIIQGVTCDISSSQVGANSGAIVISNDLSGSLVFSGMSLTARNGASCSVDSPTIAAGAVGSLNLSSCSGLTPGKSFDATINGNYTVNSQIYPVSFKFVKKVHA